MKKFLLVAVMLLALACPAFADGWFPRMNERGEVASGAGIITVLGRDVGVGWGPEWIDNDHIVYNGADNNSLSVIFNVRTFQREATVPQSYNVYAAGGGRWMGLFQGNPIVIRRYQGTQVIQEIPDAGSVVMSRNGRWGYVAPFHATTKTFFVNGQAVVTDTVFDVSLTERSTVWSTFTGRFTKAVFAQINGGPTQNISVLDWEGPTACDAPDATWVVSVTQSGLIARKAGRKTGYKWDGGEFFNPSCVVVNGQLRIASSSSRGVLQILEPTGPEVDLTVTPPPPPPPPPLDELPAGICQALKDERKKYPSAPNCRVEVRNGNEVQVCMSGDQIGDLLNRVAFQFKQAGFGLSGKDFGTHCDSKAGPIACDIIQRRSDNAMWDVLGSAGEETTVNCGRAIGFQTDLNRRPYRDAVNPGDGGTDPSDHDVLALKAEIVKLQGELNTVRGRLTDAESARDNARNRVGELERERDELKASIDNKDRRIGELEQERDELKRRIEELGQPLTCQLVGQQRIFGVRIGGRCEAVR